MGARLFCWGSLFYDAPRSQLFRCRVATPTLLVSSVVLLVQHGLKVDAAPLPAWNPAGDVKELQDLLAGGLKPVRDACGDENPLALAKLCDECVARAIELDASPEDEPRRLAARVSMGIGLAALQDHLDPDVQSSTAAHVQVLLPALLVVIRPHLRRLVLVKGERVLHLLLIHVTPPVVIDSPIHPSERAG